MTDTPTTAPGLEEQIQFTRLMANYSLNQELGDKFRAILASLERLRDIQKTLANHKRCSSCNAEIPCRCDSAYCPQRRT